MYVSKEEDGIWLRALPVWVMDTLMRLSDWVQSDDPRVLSRLRPNAYEDAEQDREWRDALGSSLEHLVATRSEIVNGDLRKMEVCAGQTDDEEEEDGSAAFAEGPLFNVWIPGAHVAAWADLLQAGTHALFILDGLTHEDVERGLEEVSIDPEKRVAMLRLSILQEILVRIIEN